MAGEFHHGELHPEADAKEGNVVFPGVADGPHLALGSPFPEAAGDQYPIGVLEPLFDIAIFNGNGSDPIDVDFMPEAIAGMVEGHGDG